MTTNAHAPMNCDEFTERSMDYMEGDVDAATRLAMDAHLARCAACSALVADMRQIATAAARLPELTPSRDLWAGIAARIEAPVIALDARASRARRAPAWLRPAVAAAALMIATSSITYYATRRTSDSTRVASSTQVASARSSDSSAQPVGATQSPESAATVAPGVEPTQPAQPAVTAVSSRSASSASAHAAGAESADATYDLEIRHLRTIIKQRRSQVDTATIAIIEKNLKIIDDAIAQCRAALARDPNSRFLLENLNSALDNKVQLLRTAAMLPART